VPRGPDLTLDEVKRNSIRLSAAAMGIGHADGFSALGVASALLLGLLAKKRGAPGQSMMTSMLSTMAHTLSEDMVEYESRPPLPTPGVELYGLGARYRLYRASDGWVFLAAPSDKEWSACARALDLADTLDDDELSAVLEERFATKSADEWERELGAHDVTCAAVVTGPIEEVVMLSGGMGKELGIVTDITHPVLGDYSRLLPLVRYERLGGVAGPAPLCGAQTDAVLAELGYSTEEIDRLREEHVLG
jgi:crotonobetainyl-CoA:carnitine CoA-transferase CaiB-like acyl-CoA transferase